LGIKKKKPKVFNEDLRLFAWIVTPKKRVTTETIHRTKAQDYPQD